jgi:hypothetical protein
MNVRKTFATKVIRTDASRHNAVALALQAIADWEVFFQHHCLKDHARREAQPFVPADALRLAASARS